MEEGQGHTWGWKEQETWRTPDLLNPQGNGAEPGGAGWGLEPLGQGKVSMEGVHGGKWNCRALKSLLTQTSPGFCDSGASPAQGKDK